MLFQIYFKNEFVQQIEALDSLGVWHKCELVEVKDRDHYQANFTSWPSTYGRIVGKEIRRVTALESENVALLPNHRYSRNISKFALTGI